MKRDYPLVLAVVALLGTVVVLLVAWCSFGWAGVIGATVSIGVVVLAARSSHTRQSQTWYWDRADSATTRPHRPRGGVR